METKVKSNGTAKKVNATVKKEVQKKLTEEAIGKAVTPEKLVVAKKPEINLDDRIQKFENLQTTNLIIAWGFSLWARYNRCRLSYFLHEFVSR